MTSRATLTPPWCRVFLSVALQLPYQNVMQPVRLLSAVPWIKVVINGGLIPCFSPPREPFLTLVSVQPYEAYHPSPSTPISEAFSSQGFQPSPRHLLTESLSCVKRLQRNREFEVDPPLTQKHMASQGHIFRADKMEPMCEKGLGQCYIYVWHFVYRLSPLTCLDSLSSVQIQKK